MYCIKKIVTDTILMAGEPGPYCIYLAVGVIRTGKRLLRQQSQYLIQENGYLTAYKLKFPSIKLIQK